MIFQIVYFPHLELVCLRPSILVTNLIGPLLSSPDVFPISAVTAASGKATKAEMEKALGRFKEKQELEGNPSATFSISEAISVMLDLGLCCQVQGEEDVFYLPSLIEEVKPKGVWKRLPDLAFYRGRRYRVSNERVDIVPPPLFSVLQSRCSNIPGYCILLWQHGLKLESDGGSDAAECLIEMTDTRKSIDVIVRCHEGDEKAAKRTISKVKEVIEAVHDERAPGTPMEWCYLSTDDLRDHKQDVAVYKTNTAIEKQRLNERIRAERSRDGGFPMCQVKDLLFPVSRGEDDKEPRFPDDDEKASEFLIKAVASAARGKWQNICCELLDTCDLEDIRRKNDESRVCLQIVLELWVRRRGRRATVGRLVKACKRSQISRSCIEDEYEDLFL